MLRERGGLSRKGRHAREAPESLRSRIAAAGAATALVAAAVAATTGSAAAVGLTPVPSFSSNPGNLAMYEYVPAGLLANRPVVVAMHGCTQTATDYYTNSGWPK